MIPRRKGILLGMVLIVLLLPPVYGMPNDSNDGMISSTLTQGDFIEYRVESSTIILWNYTLDNGRIITRDDMESRSVIITPGLVNEITIRIDVISSSNNEMNLSINYFANPTSGYHLNHRILVEYDSETSVCYIVNGSLAEQTGILNLFSKDDWVGEEITISELEENVTSRYFGEDVRSVMDDIQTCSIYECRSLEPIDGEQTHRRYYDKDSHLLVRSTGSISDWILLGLANISYALGSLTLIDTTIDLGMSYSSFATIALSLVLVVAFVIVILFFKWRKKHISGKPAIEKDAFSEPEDEARRFPKKLYAGIQSHRKTIAIAIILLMIIIPISSLTLNPELFEEPPETHPLFSTPAGGVQLVLGQWLFGEVTLPSTPPDKELIVYFDIEVTDWGSCPEPLLFEYRVNTLSLSEFTAMNQTERDELIANGQYFNDRSQTHGIASAIMASSGTYIWYCRFVAPYHNNTSSSLQVRLAVYYSIESAI